MAGQNRFRTKPEMTKAAAISFQKGKDSSKKKAEAPMPKIGTNSGAGATTPAGCLESSQAQAA